MQDQGIAVENIFIDTASGSIVPEKRPEFKRMYEKIKTCGVSELVFSEYSRIGRTSIESLSAVLNIMKLGIKIQSLANTENIINRFDPDIQLVMISMAMSVAQRERERTRERTKWGMDNARAKGTRSGRPIGRPEVYIDMDMVTKLKIEKDLKEKQAIRVLGYKESTYYKRKREMKLCTPKTSTPNKQAE
jgi:DNA invertase Pin-like site-specific DNA recombinase